MMKPGIGTYDRFKQMFDEAAKKAGKEYFLIPYFIAAHPGTTDEDMLNLALWLKKNRYRADQVQTFLPSPMAVATAMYHSGVNPLRGVRRGGSEAVETVEGPAPAPAAQGVPALPRSRELAAAARDAEAHGPRRPDRPGQAPAGAQLAAGRAPAKAAAKAAAWAQARRADVHDEGHFSGARQDAAVISRHEAIKHSAGEYVRTVVALSTAKKLALIATGYALSFVGGLAAIALNELRMSVDDAQASSGMAAFGDMVLFVLVVGFLGLVPTWFLLKLLIENAPRTLLAIMLLLAAMGPASWLAATYLASDPGDASLPNLPRAVTELLALLIPFVPIPRMVFGPVLLVIEGAMFLLARERVTRAVLAAAMLMDIVPLGLFALHLVRAIRY